MRKGNVWGENFLRSAFFRLLVLVSGVGNVFAPHLYYIGGYGMRVRRGGWGDAHKWAASALS